MAPTLRLRVSHILWLACLLHLAPAMVAAGRYELRLVSDSPATTGAEVNVTASLEAPDNGSLALPAGARAFRFHWVHSPLLLTGKADEAFQSTIHAVGSAPGDFPVSVWVTADNCHACRPVARASLVLSFTDSIVGKLVIAQNESLPTPSKHHKLTMVFKMSFLLHDPSDFFQTSSFLYSWDFGDGTQMVTEDPTVYYERSIKGTFTVKLKVVASREEAAPAAGKGVVQKTGHFSDSMKLQENLQDVLIVGPTQIEALQEVTMTLNFVGTPPLVVCWTVQMECFPLMGECSPESVTSTVYNLTVLITDPGDYCIHIRAQNAISKIHTCRRIQVWSPFFQLSDGFAFPYVYAILTSMMMGLIIYMILRNTGQQKDTAENPEPPVSDKNPEPPTEAKCCPMCCVPFLTDTPSEYLEVARENHELPSLYKSAKTYTV